MDVRCLICNHDFISNQPNAKFCNEKCRNKNNSLKKRNKFNDNTTYVLTENDFLNEKWVIINDIPNYYISNLGRVKNIYSGKIKSVHKNKVDGYFYTSLSLNGKSHTKKIHRLVAEHFIDNPQNLQFVDHIYGDKSDNRHSSLRWVTFIENIQSAWDIGIYKNKGDENKLSILTSDKVREIKLLLKNKVPAIKIANKYGVTNWAIHDIKQGRTWKHIQI